MSRVPVPAVSKPHSLVVAPTTAAHQLVSPAAQYDGERALSASLVHQPSADHLHKETRLSIVLFANDVVKRSQSDKQYA